MLGETKTTKKKQTKICPTKMNKFIFGKLKIDLRICNFLFMKIKLNTKKKSKFCTNASDLSFILCIQKIFHMLVCLCII